MVEKDNLNFVAEEIAKIDPEFATEEDYEQLMEELLDDTNWTFVTPVARVTSYQELLSCLYDSEVKYMFWKNSYEKTEADLWLNTDWDEVFENKKPTVKDKEMWIRNELVETKELCDTCKLNYDNYKRMYKLALEYGLEVL